MEGYLKRAMGCEHSTEVIQCHGHKHDPSGPLRDEGEGVGSHHSCCHQVPLLHQDGCRRKEEGNHTNHL